jgi:hypothetical protein
METNFSEEYKNWIETLSEPNFKELVKDFVKEYYNTKSVCLCDGPYDGGIDLIIINDKQMEIKRNIQITVQRTGYKTKLINDLKKSKENVDKYSYLNKLDFYINSTISQSNINKLKREAEVDYLIDLNIYDANRLAELANEYKSIRKAIEKFHQQAFPKEKISVDKNTKILFDTLSLNKDMTAIKTNFIQSLILSHLYQKGQASTKELYNSLKDCFFEKVQENIIQSEIGKLKKEGKIIDIPESQPKKFKLVDSTTERMKQIDETAQMNESMLIHDFEKILNKYSSSLQAKEIAEYIMKLYNANYEIDENEVLKPLNNHEQKIQGIFKSFISYLQKEHYINELKANDIARELLVVCERNSFLNKVSISKMFMNLFKSDKLEEYLNSSKRIIFIDTQVLLQIICCKFEETSYSDQLYNATKTFLNTIQQSSIDIELHTTNEYIEEVAWHILTASKLENFLSLPYIQDLGKSKNVFFNFYLNIKEEHEYNDFNEFINELLDVDITQLYSDQEKVDELVSSLLERLDLLNIEVNSIPKFEEYDKYKKEYENTLSYIKNDQKSYEARKHDLNTVLYISMYYDSEEGTFPEPFLITWDTSFFEVRKSFRKFGLNYWYLYPPLKFANTISVINLKIDSKVINYNIISLVEENFNLSNESISFIDLISELFNDKNISEWKLIDKLTKLRKKLQENIKKEDFTADHHKNLPIDELLLLMQNYYRDPNNHKNYKDYVKTFQNDANADRISLLIENHLEDFQSKEGINILIIEEMDKIISYNR